MTLQIKYPTNLIFACASYAARVNGGYCKVAEYGPFNYETNSGGELRRQTNKLVLLDALNDQSVLTEADHAHSEITRQFCQGLIIRQLAHGNLSEFHQKMMECANQDEVRVADSGIIAYAPIFSDQQTRRQDVAERLENTTKAHIGAIGQKIKLTIEVIRSTYSQQYGCYFITAIADSNNTVFFSYKTALELNQKYSLEGRVKAHRDGAQTQLNYVKI